MVSWPANWIQRALTSIEVPITGESIRVMRAWRTSTPLPPLTNNPVGMPVHSSGSPAYMGTGYAIFPTMDAFYAAFKAWTQSQAGHNVAQSMTLKVPYAATWRAISALDWPGSLTETDYPSALLDLASESYRATVSTSPASARKTSGTVGADPAVKATIAEHSAVLHRAISSGMTGVTLVRSVIRGTMGNG